MQQKLRVYNFIFRIQDSRVDAELSYPPLWN